MNAPEVSGKDELNQKDRYHHGDLREALITAAREQISEHGLENFSLATACRSAGVSTAAPYKHFRDRDEILEEVTAQGFEALADRSMAAVERAGTGTLEGIIAMGEAYVEFACKETGLFRVMFGQHPVIKDKEHVSNTGRSCFGQVIEQVAIYCERQGVEGDAHEIAVRLWTFVHGAASLLIDQDYEKVAPGIDIPRLIAKATPGLLRP